MKSKRLLAIIVTVVSLVFGANSVIAHAQGNKVTAIRIGGQDRIETSVKIANEYNSGQIDTVVVATANDFKEALVGSTLASKYKSPILLVNQTVKSSQATLDYIKSHLSEGGKVYILGNTSSVSSDIETAIRSMEFSNIKRLVGYNEAGTLKAINDEVNVAQGTPVIIASDTNFPDALSASAIAAIKGYPILLCDSGYSKTTGWSDGLSQQVTDQLKNIRPSKIFIVGGVDVIPYGMTENIMDITGVTSANAFRMFGWDRYGTSVAINRFFKPDINTDRVIIASGFNFPDAISGSSLAAKYNAPILLTGKDTFTTKQYIDNNSTNNITVLGGIGSVSSSTVDALVAPQKPGVDDTYLNPNQEIKVYPHPDDNNITHMQPYSIDLWDLKLSIDSEKQFLINIGYTEQEAQDIIESKCEKDMNIKYDYLKKVPPGICRNEM